MNTIQELIENGIDIKTADKMLHDYIARIGTLNGVYKIIDINYDVELRGKDVTMQCIKCGIDGTQRPLTEWYEFYGITAPAVAYRVKVLGMTREDAIKKPKYT